MTIDRLEDPGLAEAAGKRLSEKTGSSFAAIGAAACRRHAEAAFAALREDLRAAKTEALRRAVKGLVEELLPHGLRFAELRFFVQTLRAAAGEALSDEPEARHAADGWFVELALVCSMQFVVQREAEVQQRAVKLEVKHLESQLDELRAAVAEKSELLERIRQVSTPIAPVVEGILVVPLVGTVDAERTALMTERLLQAVSQARAQVVILDITGVPVFDAEAAQLIVRLAQSVRLLGAELLLVGVGPTTARTIVELAIDLSGLRALGSLQDGLALALQMRRLTIARL
jgi:anti-anti-sigma factor